MVSINDLRSFLKLLEERGELVRVKRSVSTKFELSSVARRSEIEDGPAPLFENVEGYSMPVVTGLLSKIDRMALGIGVEKGQILQKITKAVDNPIKPKIADGGPVKDEVVLENIDLLKMLPIPIHAEKDGGPFISAGVVIGKDPETGRRNLSYNRMHVKGQTKLGIHDDPWRHLDEFYRKADVKGKPLEIAICIGLDPAIELAAAARVPYDEFELAGAMKGIPIELVKCETVDIEVPTNTEIVIEGKMPPTIREPEGPFAEYTGYYGMADSQQIVEVTAVTHREKPIYRTIVGASVEHVILGNVVSREPVLYKFVKHAVPEVKAVHIQPYSAGYHAIISIKKEKEGMPKQAIFAALTSHINIKHVIVVDEDVDIFDPKDVFWAIATRVQGDKDVMIVPGAYGPDLDRTTEEGVTAKIGIDATAPLDRKEDFTRVKHWKIDEINLKDYNI